MTSAAGLLCCGCRRLPGSFWESSRCGRPKRTGQDGFGLAVAEMALGGVVVALVFVYIIFVVIVSASGMPSPDRSSRRPIVSVHHQSAGSKHVLTNRPHTLAVMSVNRVYAARLAGMVVLGPDGESLGRVRDIVIGISIVRQQPRVLGLVVELLTRRRIFVPILRVTAIEPGAVTLNAASVSCSDSTNVRARSWFSDRCSTPGCGSATGNCRSWRRRRRGGRPRHGTSPHTGLDGGQDRRSQPAASRSPVGSSRRRLARRPRTDSVRTGHARSGA